MIRARLGAVIACSLLLISSVCLGQGSATVWELRGLAGAAELIGSSAVVRGAVERLLTPARASALLGLPAKEFGLEVIKTDQLAKAVALDPAIVRAGQTEAFLASVNSIRSMTAQAQTGLSRSSASTSKTLELLSLSNSRPLTAGVSSTSVEQRIAGELSKQTLSFSLEGLKLEPGIKIPVWSTRGTSGQLVLDNVKWSQVAAGSAAVCAVTTPCAEGISEQLKRIIGTQPGR